MTYDGRPHVRLSDDKTHLLWSHECNFPDLTGATYHLDVPLPIDPELGWRVTKEEPLTVAPSILCMSCKMHGFWENGRWVGA